MTSPVKAKTPAEFLVALPRMLGYTPANSIVVQTFQKRRTAASLRIDLPDDPVQGQRLAVADAIIRLISRVPGVDAVLLVVYSDEEWEVGAALPRAELLESIVTRMASAGLGIIDALCSTDRVWASYLDEEHGTIDELQSDRLQAELDAVAEFGDPRGMSQGAPPIDRGGDEECRAVADAAHTVADDDLERERLWQWAVARVLWTDAIESVPSDIPADAIAALLWSIRDKGVRDCVLMQLAWGDEAGERAAVDTELLHRGVGVPRGSILETFVGDGRAAPGGLRIEGAVRLLRHLVSVAPKPWQLAPLTMLAWCEWSRGHGSAAGDYLDQALSIGPGYELARLFEHLISSGRIPDWVGRSPQ